MLGQNDYIEYLILPQFGIRPQVIIRDINNCLFIKTHGSKVCSQELQVSAPQIIYVQPLL